MMGESRCRLLSRPYLQVPPLILMTRHRYVSYSANAIIRELLIYEADLYDNIAR